MFLLLKKHDLKTIRFKLLLIYGLNLLDILFTLVLMKTGIFAEGNILMKNVVEDVPMALGVKVLLAGVLIAALYIRIEKANEKQLRISNVLVNCVAILYAGINFLHVLWTILSLLLILSI